LGIFKLNEDFVGIEVGNTAVRLVQLKKNGNAYSLVSFGSAQLPPKLAQSDSKIDMQKVANVISQLVKSSRINTKFVATALPASAVFSTVIKLPPMSPQELEKAVRYQAEQNLPLKIEDVRLDWQVIRENPTTHEMVVMVVSAPNQKAMRSVELFNMAGLDVIFLETSPIATARALVDSSDAIAMVVDLGASATEITIVENGIVSHVRSIPAAGYAMTRTIMQTLGLDNSQAEQFKMKFGLSQSKLEGQVFKTLRPILTNITDEITRSMKFYNDQFGTTVNKVILTGGGSKMPDLASYIKQTLGVEVVYASPWSKISAQPELTDTLAKMAPEFGCAVGLAMRDGK
jgi:type IV pilus assembly protein PilM